MDKEKKVLEKKPEVKKAKTIKDYYTLGTWKRFTQYKCSLCPFDSLDEESIISHINERHIIQPPRPVKQVTLFDRFGREIIKKNK